MRNRRTQSSRSQRSQSFSQTQTTNETLDESSNVGDEEQELAENNLVRYMLTFLKSRLPIRKSNIIKIILNGSARKYKNILQGAKNKLADVYGLDLIEVPQMSPNKGYIIVTKFKKLIKLNNRTHKTEYAIVFLALAHIFMSNGKVTEESLFAFFEKLNWNLTNSKTNKENFEKIKDVIKQYTQMLYFQRDSNTVQRARQTGVEVVEYSWGIRAENEVSKRDVLRFVSEVCGKAMTSYESQMKCIPDDDD